MMGTMIASHSFPSAPDSMAPVRRFVEATLAGHQCVADASLVADELATNAFQHTDAKDFAVALAYDDDQVHITVSAAPAVVYTAPHICPNVVNGRAGGTRGRGLFIVDALSEYWGVATVDGRQLVYAVLTLNPDGEGPADLAGGPK
jgi:serine/threonine-protein kinase RsbW